MKRTYRQDGPIQTTETHYGFTEGYRRVPLRTWLLGILLALAESCLFYLIMRAFFLTRSVFK